MTIFDDFQARESRVWNPFGFSMRFDATQVVERVIIFGLYSGSYKNGMDYLVAYEAFELALIVDDYNSKISKLNSEEQNVLLDIATKRYLTSIEAIIHAEQLDTKRAAISASDAEWDAKFEALIADQAAVETMRLKFVAYQLNISAKIQTLQAQITLEEVNFELAEVALLNQKLDVTNAENRLTGKDIELANKDIEAAEKDIMLGQKNIEIMQKKLDLLSKSSAIARLELQEAQTELSTTEVGIDVLKIQNQVIETGLRQLDVDRDAANMGIQSAQYEKDITKTVSIQADLISIETEKTLDEIELTSKDNQLLEIDLESQKTELKKKQVDFEYVEVDQKIAGINVDIEQTKNKIAETENLEAQKLLEQARLSATEAGLEIYEKKGLMLDNKFNSLVDETAAKQEKLITDADIHSAESVNINTKNQLKLKTLEIQEEETIEGYDEKSRGAVLDGELIEKTRIPYTSMTDKEILTLKAKTYSAKSIDKASIESLQKIMAAEITTNLMHSVSKE